MTAATRLEPAAPHRLMLGTSCLLALSLLFTACAVADIPTAQSVGYTLIESTVVPTAPPEPTATPVPTPVSEVAGDASAADVPPTATPTPIPQPGVSASTLRLGIIGDIDTGGGDDGGSIDGYASAAFDAIAAWARLKNDQGGIAGRRIEIVPRDSGFGFHPDAVRWMCDPQTDVFALVGSKSFFDGDGIDLFDDGVCPIPDFPTAALSSERRQAPNTFLANPWLSLYYQVGPLNWLADRHPGAADNAAVLLHSTTTSRIETDRLAEALEDTYSFVVREQVRYDENYVGRVETLRDAGAQSLIWTLSADRLVQFLAARAFVGPDGENEDELAFIVCIEDCYSRTFLADAGSLAEGVYTVLPHLPFDEANFSPELGQYLAAHDRLDNPGAAPSTVGVQAWNAARLFEEALDLSLGDGPAYDPDSIDRERVIGAAGRIDAWDARGILGSEASPAGRIPSPCYVLMQVQDGQWSRVHPLTPGMMDCTATNLAITRVTAGLTGGSRPPAPRPVDDAAVTDEVVGSADPLDQ